MFRIKFVRYPSFLMFLCHRHLITTFKILYVEYQPIYQISKISYSLMSALASGPTEDQFISKEWCVNNFVSCKTALSLVNEQKSCLHSVVLTETYCCILEVQQNLYIYIGIFLLPSMVSGLAPKIPYRLTLVCFVFCFYECYTRRASCFGNRVAVGWKLHQWSPVLFVVSQIRELVPESQAYMDLLAFERKLDQTIMRKRLDIQEALKRPIKVCFT